MLTGYTYGAGKGITQNRQYRLQQNLFAEAELWTNAAITVAFDLLLSFGPNAEAIRSLSATVNAVTVNIDTHNAPS